MSVELKYRESNRKRESQPQPPPPPVQNAAVEAELRKQVGDQNETIQEL
jgi:hypothetical protein